MLRFTFNIFGLSNCNLLQKINENINGDWYNFSCSYEVVLFFACCSGNNDGKNLSAPEQFRSKEISKSNVVDDMVASNRLLYAPHEKPDHVVVIKYVPYVGDSKRSAWIITTSITLFFIWRLF